MSRWLAIDPGTRRIGVAVGGADNGIASPLAVLDAKPLAGAIAEVLRLAGEYQVQGIVVGWPLNMDDTEGPQGRHARQLAGELAKATSLDVRMWDERLSSYAADKSLAGLLTRKKRKARQDALAAASLLREFLAAGGPASAKRPAEIDASPPTSAKSPH